MLRDSLRTGRERQSLFVHQYRDHLSTQQPPVLLNRPPHLMPALPPQPLPPDTTPTSGAALPHLQSAAMPTSEAQAAAVLHTQSAATPTPGEPPSPKPSHQLREQDPARKPQVASGRDVGGWDPGGRDGGGQDTGRNLNTEAFNKYNASHGRPVQRAPPSGPVGLDQLRSDLGAHDALQELLAVNFYD